MKFRPTFWPTVCFVPMFLSLLALGGWQLQRLYWKEGLIAQRTAAVSAPAIPLPSDPAAAPGFDFRHLGIEGEFLNDRELFLGASTDGGAAGYHVVTPFKLKATSDQKDGGVILVDRGWITSNLKDPAKRAEGQITGTVKIEGLLRLPPKGRPNFFVPENRCDINYWFYVDIPAMASCVHLEGVLPYYMDAGPAPNAGGWPKGGQSRLSMPSDHLQYALTWFLLAAALAFIYYLYHRRLGEPKPEGSDKA